MRLILYIAFAVTFCNVSIRAQDLITNVYNRSTTSLNGQWNFIIDPYETGFLDYRSQERNEKDPGAYWNSDIPDNKSVMLEHGYVDGSVLHVPGDWNSQDSMLLYYEGSIWYQKSFDYKKQHSSNRLFLYFSGVNYRADVYLNGHKLGTHLGGFTPFQFEIVGDFLKDKGNFLVVRVNNTRQQDEVPTLNTDWWNYGGITRDVMLVETPAIFIEDYSLRLSTPSSKLKPVTKNAEITGWVKLNGTVEHQTVTIEIPELKIEKTIDYTGSPTQFSINLPRLELWSDKNPKRYEVIFKTSNDRFIDKVGFRRIEVAGTAMLLNGEAIFLRGICTHEEFAPEVRRASSKADAERLLGWAKELNTNFVRLAHYPHNEHIIRAADSLGILLWSEIPVYWTINFESKEVLKKAKRQLWEMIKRDHNRASVIIWSVGNETPVSVERTKFMKSLIDYTRSLDDTRLVTAALEVHYNKDVNVIDDPLGAYTDLVSVNQYLGWYIGLPDHCRTAKWQTIYDKPLFFSETGAGAKQGYHADSLTRWSEEYQEWFYEEQVAMMKRMPENFIGLAPWILIDFRSPRRNNPYFQQGWNRKGLISNDGKKKKAFYILRDYYNEIEDMNH